MNIVKPADLQPADILLFHGNGILSKFIRLFDGSQYSHAAIYDGQNVVEAEVEQGDAIRVDTVAVSCTRASFTHVYRFISNDHKRIGVELPPDPILQNVDELKKTPAAYAYSQILLLGILLATRRVPLVPGLAPMLRPFMDEAAEKLNEFVNGKRKVIICSELVYQCFNQAPAAYQIYVEGVDPSVVSSGLQLRANLMPTVTPETDATDLLKDAAAFLAMYMLFKGQPHPAAVQPAQSEPASPLPKIEASFVTPRDLATSPNLALVGQLLVGT